MSETPETDAKVRTFEVPTKFGRHTRKTCVVHIEFARDLERRLIATRTALRDLCDKLLLRMVADNPNEHALPLIESHRRAEALLASEAFIAKEKNP